MTEPVVAFRPHWLNGPWLRAFTDPYVDVDGETRLCSWRTPTHIPVEAGERTVRAYVRYRRVISGDGGVGSATIRVRPGESAAVVVTNSITNASPFVPRPT